MVKNRIKLVTLCQCRDLSVRVYGSLPLPKWANGSLLRSGGRQSLALSPFQQVSEFCAYTAACQIQEGVASTLNHPDGDGERAQLLLY